MHIRIDNVATYDFIYCSIKTQGCVSCSQVRMCETLCVIYTNQLLAIFSHL